MPPLSGEIGGGAVRRRNQKAPADTASDATAKAKADVDEDPGALLPKNATTATSAPPMTTTQPKTLTMRKPGLISAGG